MSTIPSDVPSLQDQLSDANIQTHALPDDMAAEMAVDLNWDEQPLDVELDAEFVRRCELADAEKEFLQSVDATEQSVAALNAALSLVFKPVNSD